MKRNFFTNRHRKVWVEKKDCERKRKKVIVEARASVKRKKCTLLRTHAPKISEGNHGNSKLVYSPEKG